MEGSCRKCGTSKYLTSMSCHSQNETHRSTNRHPRAAALCTRSGRHSSLPGRAHTGPHLPPYTVTRAAGKRATEGRAVVSPAAEAKLVTVRRRRSGGGASVKYFRLRHRRPRCCSHCKRACFRIHLPSAVTRNRSAPSASPRRSRSRPSRCRLRPSQCWRRPLGSARQSASLPRLSWCQPSRRARHWPCTLSRWYRTQRRRR